MLNEEDIQIILTHGLIKIEYKNINDISYKFKYHSFFKF